MGRAILTFQLALACALSASGRFAHAVEPTASVGKPTGRPTRVAPSMSSAFVKATLALDRGDAEAALAIIHDRNSTLSKTEELYIRGRARLLQGKLSAARRDLQSAIRSNKRNADAHYWLARVYQADGAHALATSSFQKAYAFGLGSADLHFHWAQSLRACDDVVGDVRQRIWSDDYSTAPEPGQFEYDGLVLGPVRGRPDTILVAPKKSALYQIHKAMAADASRADIELLAGVLWASIDRHRMAASLFKRAAASLKDESLAKCHRNWANSSLALGRLDSYLEHSKREMELSGGVDPDQLATLYERAADEASNRGNLKKQIRYLTLAAETNSTPKRCIKLADALLSTQNPIVAERYLKLALLRHPTKTQRAAIKLRLLRTTYLASPDGAR